MCVGRSSLELTLSPWTMSLELFVGRAHTFTGDDVVRAALSFPQHPFQDKTRQDRVPLAWVLQNKTTQCTRSADVILVTSPLGKHFRLPPFDVFCIALYLYRLADRTSMKDGSITIARPIEPGTRLQLFVRDR